VIARARRFRPFSSTGRGTIIAIFGTFALISILTVTLSIRATQRSQNRATVVEVAGRQRTLAERYVKEILLIRAGQQAEPALTAALLAQSAQALLDGGTAPAVNGDDDETKLAPASGATLRRQLVEEQRLVKDLSAYGSALIAKRVLTSVPVAGGERLQVANPIQGLRIVGALTSVVALNISRTIAAQADNNINDLITMQVALGIGGLLVSLLLAWALIATTRRQTAHFRSLVTSSSDLVVVLGADGCRYASRSVCKMVGMPEQELLGGGFEQFVHEQDRPAVTEAQRAGLPQSMMLRVRNAAGEWRHLEAHITDLRRDRNLRGVVLNARDVTERVRLEHELMIQAQRDTFGSQLGEALEMADEEHTAYDVVERAMAEISADSPMELLLSDSSRAHLERTASNPSAGAPGCPVESPFSCVAVRRGHPVEFESSEALNACPKLRGRPDGACSAVCVPVSFMGRALGVLHATGPEGNPPNGDKVSRLTALATQAGARIGTVRAFEKTQLRAATDGLTGLVNRRTLETQVRSLIKGGEVFALAVADLDYFKAVNDAHGHEAGDRALRLFAQVAQDALRDDDVLARWGGEEFVFILPGLDRHHAVGILERIRERLAAAHTGDHPRFTVSFGVTDSEAAETLEQMMSIADSGLYESKESGRDRITIGKHPLSVSGITPGTYEGDPLPPARRRPRRSLLQEAAEEEDPRPSGLEIR
jgi:diguanylate cyclase (GGDEF)-like protein/PAS domain S-box-containing protein